jgi:thiamine kinase-like enzyme
LEKLSSPREIVFGHNDFLAANFLDDGSKIWVVDWEYGGFNDPLFDIGGLASNNDFNQDLEKEALEMYYEKPLTNDVLLKYNSMKTASLLRETMWSMVSEITSKLEFDYGEYTQENLNKFNEAFESL